ncbi:MAG: Uma2 family endonuclease [Bacteroidota bacterium]
MTLSLLNKKFTSTQFHHMAKYGILHPKQRLELLKGYIIEMTPINSEHASIVDILSELLIAALSGKAITRIQNPIQLDDYNAPEPDIAVARLQKDRYRHAHPTAKDIWLVIEVADSSLEKDRQVKTELYAAAGIAEYWIVSIPDQHIECYDQIVDGEYKRRLEVKKGASAQSMLLDLSLAVDELF